jgi:hypothetical protein
MLLMNREGTQAEGDAFTALPPEDLKALHGHMRDLGVELSKSGELVGGEALADPDQAKIVRAGSDGSPQVTDGPFPEAKEWLAGYWIVDCESIERAIEIAARTSSAPGLGGVPRNIPIEVREVMDQPSEDF